MSVAKPRLLYANRCQCEMRSDSLDQLLPSEHPVRALWQFVATLDLSAWLATIRSVPGNAGAPAIDPRILLALWLQATLDGIGSSRALAVLCEQHLVYRWLCGGVAVGYHTLADFRTGHSAALDQLLTDSVAVLLHEGLADLQRVAQDGIRVRAAAGAASFRRSQTLADCLAEAKQQVMALRTQADEDPGAASRRQQAAQQRAAAERVTRLQAAQAELQQLQQANAAQPASRQKDPPEVRVSLTDPECRKLKMADGGFRPAYNVQLATTTQGGVIVGVAVTNAGTDAGQLLPMRQQLEQRFAQPPSEMLVDGGYVSVEAIDQAERDGTAVYAPPREEQKQLQAGQDPYARKKSATAATAQWRARMGTAAAQAIYRQRARTAEWVNAQARNRGLYQLRVRGLAKVLSVVLWYALAHNFTRLQQLRADAAENGPQRARAGGD